MKSSSEFRAIAREALKGHWGEAALFVFVYALISGLCSAIPVVGSASSLLLLPMGYALSVSFLRLLRGEELQIEWLFKNFNARVYKTALLQLLYTVLWTLLLIVPGIIKAYSYAMTYFLMNDNPELSGNEAIERSMAMMDGHKMRLFILDLTFIGWYLLSILTLCIALFWIIPYHRSARAAFYEDLKAGATVAND